MWRPNIGCSRRRPCDHEPLKSGVAEHIALPILIDVITM
jgi:hypothetical protein